MKEFFRHRSGGFGILLATAIGCGTASPPPEDLICGASADKIFSIKIDQALEGCARTGGYVAQKAPDYAACCPDGNAPDQIACLEGVQAHSTDIHSLYRVNKGAALTSWCGFASGDAKSRYQLNDVMAGLTGTGPTVKPDRDRDSVPDADDACPDQKPEPYPDPDPKRFGCPYPIPDGECGEVKGDNVVVKRACIPKRSTLAMTVSFDRETRLFGSSSDGLWTDLVGDVLLGVRVATPNLSGSFDLCTAAGACKQVGASSTRVFVVGPNHEIASVRTGLASATLVKTYYSLVNRAIYELPCDTKDNGASGSCKP